MGRVCLTFDNGPDPTVTPHVLDVLERHRASALFFVLGHKLDEPHGLDLARRITDAGHRLGNHSYSHEIPLGVDERPDHVALEIERTEERLARVWDGPKWFRPFGGGGKLGPHLLSEASAEYLKTHGYTCVLWNSVPGDWLDATGWVARALEDIERQEHTLVVLHDYLPEPMERLDDFLSEVVARGHRFTDALPPSCLPIVDGQPQASLRDCIAGDTE